MVKVITVGIVSLSLMACGGGSDEIPHLNVDVSQFEGGDNQVSLTSITSSGGDSVELNTIVNSSIVEDGREYFVFVSDSDKVVSVTLSSAVEDLDLHISSTSGVGDIEGDGSNESAVFNAFTNESYSINIDAIAGGGDFSLIISEASRSSLGLRAGEYWVSFGVDFNETCDGGEQRSYSHAHGSVISFNGGYISGSSGLQRNNFSSVNGNSFTVVTSKSTTDEYGSREFSSTLTLSLNPETGGVSGIAKIRYSGVSSSDSDDSYSCSSNLIYDGRIKL